MNPSISKMVKRIMACLLAACLVQASNPEARAESVKLQGMTNTGFANMLRISFEVDHIPEFDMDVSGQRVRMIIRDASFSPAFRVLSAGDMIEPLVRVVTDGTEHDSIVEMYFRNLPSNVDVTIDRLNMLINVNVFYREESRGPRPGIVYEEIGRLRPIESGAYLRRTVSSEYAGRWIDFFREFEWPADIRLPVNLSLPPYPGPLARDNERYFPEGIFNFSIRKLCGLLGHIPSGEQGMPAGLPALMRVKCLLHDNEFQHALDVLNTLPQQLNDPFNDPGMAAWLLYFRAWATAASGNHYKAIDLLERNDGKTPLPEALSPWYRLLLAETYLAVQNPEQAMARIGRPEVISDQDAGRIRELRMADTLYALGRYDAALDYYRRYSDDLRFMQKHPESIAGLADALYRQGMFEEAYRYYFLLSESLAGAFPEKRALADYWSAVALNRATGETRATLMLWDVGEKARGTEGAFRSRLKLLDFDILGREHPPYDEIVAAYREIIKHGTARQVREEAFFKQILTFHLQGKNVEAVKLLGRFFGEYWAGDLQPEAQALFVELFPDVIDQLVEQEAFVEALALVAKHRSLLARAHITYGFLYRLAESYVSAGFLDQAARAYLYILDLEKDREKHESVFLPLVSIYAEQKNHWRVMEFASAYLDDYEDGADRADMYYYYANALYNTGDLENASWILSEETRPACSMLDAMAGRLHLEKGDMDLAEEYFSRAVSTEEGRKLVDVPHINLSRAEIFHERNKQDDALALYESVMDDPRFQGQAGYRRVQILLNRGKNREALNIYRQLSEMNIEPFWLNLAQEAVRLESMN